MGHCHRIMEQRSRLMGAFCAVAVLGVCAASAGAQTVEVKEKPKLYTYFASWAIPRSHWAEMEKPNPAQEKSMESSVANGSLLGYGADETVVHQVDGPTHDSWWSASSMSGVLDILDTLMKGSPSPALATATMHADQVLVSRYYNWHAGTYKGAYTHTALYKLKADAPDDAVDTMSRSVFVPLLEKLLAAGTIVEYEVDEEAIHTSSPDVFWLDYVSPTSAGLDKVNAAVAEALKANPLAGPALGSMLDLPPHRDYLLRGNATYK